MNIRGTSGDTGFVKMKLPRASNDVVARGVHDDTAVQIFLPFAFGLLTSD